MPLLLPIFSAVLQAASFTLDKFILSLPGMRYQTYVGVSFPLTFFITAGIFLALRPPLPIEMFQGTMGVLILLAVLYAIIGNLFFYRALSRDALGEIEIIDLLRGIPVVLVASGLFADERNIAVLICALSASVAVVWSHINHHHFVIRRATLYFLLWGLITAPIVASVSKILLVSFHPVSIELIKNGAMALVMGPIFFRYERHVSAKAVVFLIATNALSTVAWILYFYSFQKFGIVYTTLVFSLLPLLVYLSSVFILKERPHWKKNVAFVVVLASIAAAQVLS